MATLLIPMAEVLVSFVIIVGLVLLAKTFFFDKKDKE